MKIVCAEPGFDCSVVAQAETEEELLRQVAAHASAGHGLTDLTPEVMGQVKAAIKEV